MKTISISLVMILVFCLCDLQASDEKQASAELTTQLATTADGRKVILKSDGTWEYYTEKPVMKEKPQPDITPEPEQTVATPKQEPTIAVPKQSTVVTPKEEQTTVVLSGPPAGVAIPNFQEVSANLAFHASAGSQPIAGGTFYLLKQDLNQILQISGLKSEKRLSLLNTFSMANYGAAVGVERSAKTFGKAMEAIKPQIVATTTSGPDGNGQFPSVVPGVYYVMNASVVSLNNGTLSNRKAILWNVRVQIQPGQNSLTLDEKNVVP